MQDSDRPQSEVRACLASVAIMLTRARNLALEFGDKIRRADTEEVAPVESLAFKISFAELRALDVLCRDTLRRTLPDHPELTANWYVHDLAELAGPEEVVADLESMKTVLNHALSLLGATSPSEPYVAAERLAQLRLCSGGKYDLAKLIALCEELNIAYSQGLILAIAPLVRALLDHVPPIFGFTTFQQLTANYGGGRSFKEVMAFLDQSSRKIADAVLHVQVREREALPTNVQVDFRAAMDMLLQEIVRILRP